MFNVLFSYPINYNQECQIFQVQFQKAFKYTYRHTHAYILYKKLKVWVENSICAPSSKGTICNRIRNFSCWNMFKKEIHLHIQRRSVTQTGEKKRQANTSSSLHVFYIYTSTFHTFFHNIVNTISSIYVCAVPHTKQRLKVRSSMLPMSAKLLLFVFSLACIF